MSVETDTVQATLDDRIHGALIEAENDPRMQAALKEIRELIRAAYPTATFAIKHGYEPVGIRLIATIDQDDIDDANDLFGSRLVDMQVDDELPLYVHVEQPLERVLAAHQRRDEATAGVREPVAHG
jgi:hypothetical protein